MKKNSLKTVIGTETEECHWKINRKQNYIVKSNIIIDSINIERILNDK